MEKPFELLRRETSARLAKNHYFRTLTGEELEVLSVLDCRSFEGEPNNKLLVTCEHASNDTKGFKLTKEEEALVRGHDGFDPGASDLASYICDFSECTGLLSDHSKLLIDPGQHLASDSLVKFYYSGGEAISINDGIND
jgi:predicted N-formylglutamate amidohydrolase